MKWIAGFTGLLMLSGMLAGCTSTDGTQEDETLVGNREQRAILAKARPLEEFGMEPSFPYGNSTLHLGSTQLEANQSATMRFEPGGAPVVELGGKSRRKGVSALIDTASNASWIQYSCASRNGLVLLQHKGQAIPYIGQANTKGANAFAGVLPLLHLDQLTLNKTPFYVRMAKGSMQPVVYSTAAPRVDAVIGYDNLRQFKYLQFDLRNGIARFSTTEPYAPDPEALIGQAAISAVCRDQLAVNGAVGGEPVPIVLDVAGDFAFARGDTRTPATRQVELGEVVFLNVQTDVLAAQDLYPRAGRAMLENYIVTVCPRDGVVYFERPPILP